MHVVLLWTYLVAFKSTLSQVFSIRYKIMVDYVTTLGSPVNQSCQKRHLAKILLATAKKKNFFFFIVKHLKKDDVTS